MNAGPVGANGGLAANRLARDADLVIAIGTRLGDFVTGSQRPSRTRSAAFIAINVDAAGRAQAALGPDGRRRPRRLRRSRPTLGHAPARRDAEAAIGSAVAGSSTSGTHGDRPPRRDRRARRPRPGRGHRHRQRRGRRPRDASICAAGSLPGDLLKLWRAEDPKAYHVEYGYSCMGYEIAAGLGVRLAEPERDVVVMVGDGSYLMMNSEIVTAVAEGLKLTIVVLDNHGFQCILALQRSSACPTSATSSASATRPRNRLTGPYVPVDFRKHAEAMGALAPPGPDARRAARRPGQAAREPTGSR